MKKNNEQLNENNNDENVNQFQPNGYAKFLKKHTWIYDELFVKNKIVNASFEEEKEEEFKNPLKNKKMLDKYKKCLIDQNELNKEKNILNKMLNIDGKSSNKDKKDLEDLIKFDTLEYKNFTERLLRLLFQLTKEVNELKYEIHNLEK
jgi:hypothetical protein